MSNRTIQLRQAAPYLWTATAIVGRAWLAGFGVSQEAAVRDLEEMAQRRARTR